MLSPCGLLLTLVTAAVPQDTLPLRDAILAAEDARPVDRAGLAPLFTGLTSSDTVAQRLAVRGLGRQERADLVPDIAPLLSAGAASVRAEAANALGQAVTRTAAADVRRQLEDRLGIEDDPSVRAALYRTLGRLPGPREEEAARTELLLLQGSHAVGGDAPAITLEGVGHGLASLYRRSVANRPASVEAIERLVELTAPTYPTMVRRLAMSALIATGRVDSGALLDALRDEDREVRRLAVQAAGTQADLPGRERIVRRAWGDSAPGVRYEAVRAYGRRMQERDGCGPLLGALADRATIVRLHAIELLARCGAGATLTLAAIAREPLTPDDWHLPARALVSLARLAPPLADSLLDRFVESDNWWARMYAARAAGEAGLVARLERLATDAEPNVREAALGHLARRVGHAADSLYLAALRLGDPQLLITAARALDSTPEPDRALPVVLTTLTRVTRERRETSRDTRLALLSTIGTLGTARHASALRRYLTDFDPAVAEKAAEVLERWTGTRPEVRPRPQRPRPTPTWRELAALDSLRAVIRFPNGAGLVLRLFPYDAPTNVARFVRLARDGWFDGLTFHRVASNFVVQGGSPGANEYAGDGPFTRDELGLRSNLRGTVGLSTRGRDTGDGQLYINLSDNLRLDHDYTVWGEVIQGLGLLDSLLEGVKIARVELIRR